MMSGAMMSSSARESGCAPMSSSAIRTPRARSADTFRNRAGGSRSSPRSVSSKVVVNLRVASASSVPGEMSMSRAVGSQLRSNNMPEFEVAASAACADDLMHAWSRVSRCPVAAAWANTSSGDRSP